MAAALLIVAPQPGQPRQHGDRQGAGIAGADVVGQAHRLVRVGGGVREAALPQGDERAQPEGLGQQGDGAVIASEDGRAIEVAPGADPVPDEDGAAARLLDLLDDLDVVGQRERLLDRRDARRGIARDEPADAVHEPAREALGVRARLGVELGEHAVDGARVAADGGRHAGAHQQAEPRGPVRRQHRAGRVGQHGVRVGGAADGHRGHPAHPHRHPARHRVAQVGLGAIEERDRMPDATCQR